MTLPLTAELLSKRIVVLHAYMEATDPTVEPIPFERLVCDGCGFVYDLLDLAHPVGWTTSGDFKHGWRDLCRACSQ